MFVIILMRIDNISIVKKQLPHYYKRKFVNGEWININNNPIGQSSLEHHSGYLY